MTFHSFFPEAMQRLSASDIAKRRSIRGARQSDGLPIPLRPGIVRKARRGSTQMAKAVEDRAHERQTCRSDAPQQTRFLECALHANRDQGPVRERA